MEHRKLNSSHLTSCAWENGTLEIEFSSGKRYTYKNVPETVYRELMAAPSAGRYFHYHVKSIYSGRPS